MTMLRLDIFMESLYMYTAGLREIPFLVSRVLSIYSARSRVDESNLYCALSTSHPDGIVTYSTLVLGSLIHNIYKDSLPGVFLMFTTKCIQRFKFEKENGGKKYIPFHSFAPSIYLSFL